MSNHREFYVTTDGDDANLGTTPESPLKTSGEAARRSVLLPFGSTAIYLALGTYDTSADDAAHRERQLAEMASAMANLCSAMGVQRQVATRPRHPSVMEEIYDHADAEMIASIKSLAALTALSADPPPNRAARRRARRYR